MQSNCHFPYILVGAGISSLQAALILAEHKKNFIILEASNRIGGRICSLPLRQALAGDLRNQKAWLKDADNDPIECGGTWICDDNHILISYVNKYKLTRTEQFYTGKHVLAEDYQKYHQCGNLGEYYSQHKDKIMKLFTSMENIHKRVT